MSLCHVSYKELHCTWKQVLVAKFVRDKHVQLKIPKIQTGRRIQYTIQQNLSSSEKYLSYKLWVNTVN